MFEDDDETTIADVTKVPPLQMDEPDSESDAHPAKRRRLEEEGDV
jgi:hypothetical protein